MKNLSKLFFYFFLCLATITMVSCGDDDDDDNNDDDNGPDPSDIAEGSLVFTLDGEEIVFNFVVASLTTDEELGTTGNAELLSLGGTDTELTGILSLGVIDENEISEQTYDLIDEETEDADFTMGAIFSYIILDEDQSISTIFISTDASSGNVTITDLDRVGETVSGTFSGSLLRREFDDLGNVESAETATITNGAFNQVNFF